MERVLTDESFRVSTAASTQEATAKTAADPPDVAVLDYLLPDGDGVFVATELLRDHPGARIVIVSGTDLDSEPRAVARRHDIRFLRKPFLIREFLVLVREFLAAIRSVGSRVRQVASGGS
jgi:DNA-binding response OmpR family regulator